MFDLDRWQEILYTIRKHKLRTALTAFGVFWGIFMLVLLLGAGNGLQNGVENQFAGDAVNGLWVWGRKTSIPYQGLPADRTITLDHEDFLLIQSMQNAVNHVVKRQELNGEFVMRRGDKYASFNLLFTEPDYPNIRTNKITSGRFINSQDVKERRKVVVIGKDVLETLFAKEENPLGKYINIRGVEFKVIGTFSNPGLEREDRRLYAPFETGDVVYNFQHRPSIILMNSKATTVEDAKAVRAQIRTALAAKHHFSPDDEQALTMNDSIENYTQLQGLFQGIRIFVWVVGLGTLLAGVIGVSNIMLIIVKERTKEIGIRKALGAKPWSIVSLVLQESILITSVAGYLGLVAGVALLEGAALLMRQSAQQGSRNTVFQDPGVDLKLALIATGILVFAGALAGFFPARQAASVPPIEALRAD